MKKLILIFILASIIWMPIVFSFSLSPGHTRFYFEPGLKTTVSFTVNNYDGPSKVFTLVPSSSTDELSQIINEVVYIEEPELVIGKGDGHVFSVDITLPDSLSYGKHEIIINIFGNDPTKEGMVSVQTLLGYKVLIFSVFPGKYAEGHLLPITPINRGQVAMIKTSVTSYGTENIDSIGSKIDIYGDEGYIESTYSSDTSLPARGGTELVALLATKDYAIGEYTVKAVIQYDGLIGNVSGTGRLRIGELFVDIIDISSKKFQNNQINKFNVIVESKWNRPTDVYAEIIVTDALGKERANFKTQTVSAEGWKATGIPAYFDVHDIENGRYKLKVTLNYESKTSEKEFDIEIADSGEAEIVKEMPGMPKETLIIIVQGVIILLLLVIGLIFLLKLRRLRS